MIGDTLVEEEGELVPQQQLLLEALLRIVPHSAIGEAVELGLRAAGHSEVRSVHMPVLQPLFLRPDGVRLADLAAWAHITEPSMAYLVQHLEAQRYVECSSDPVDGRAQQVRITKRGLAVLQIIHDIVLKKEAEWAEYIGPERLDQLRQILLDLAHGILTNQSRRW